MTPSLKMFRAISKMSGNLPGKSQNSNSLRINELATTLIDSLSSELPEERNHPISTSFGQFITRTLFDDYSSNDQKFSILERKRMFATLSFHSFQAFAFCSDH